MKVSLFAILLVLNVTLSLEQYYGDDSMSSMSGDYMQGDSDESASYGASNMGGFQANLAMAEPMVSSGTMMLNGRSAQNFVGRTKYFTSRRTLKPKIIEQRVTAKPKIITQRVVQPIRKTIISEPTIIREKYNVIPKFVKSAPQQKVKPTKTLQTRYTKSQSYKTVKIPANEIHNQPIIRPFVEEREQVVEILPAQTRKFKNKTIIKPTKYKKTSSTKTIQIPARQIIKQDYIQPIFQKEKVNVQFVDAPAKYFTKKSITRSPIIKQKIKRKTVQVPGNEIHMKTIIKPFLKQERVNVKIQKSDPVYITRDAIRKPTKTTREVKRIVKDVVHEVPIIKTIGVPTPVIYRVPEIRYIPTAVHLGHTNSYAYKSLKSDAIRGGFVLPGGSFQSAGANFNDASNAADDNANFDFNANDNADFDFNADAEMIGDKL